MAKTLGLDLGTNSIGWAVVDDEKEGNKIVDKGVLIFSEGIKKARYLKAPALNVFTTE